MCPCSRHSGHGTRPALRAARPHHLERRRASLRELGDLYGQAGFDVLCVTDHVLRSDDPWRLPETCVHQGNFGAYIAAVDAEAERARALYGLLVVPGLEITHNHEDPELAAHAVAVGLRDFVTPDEGLVGSLLAAREAGAALIAAHPHGPDADPVPARTTRRLWLEWETLRPLFHRAELFNGTDVYSWVAGADVPPVANGDTHSRGHLSSWKTIVPCASDEEALVSFLRSPGAAYLVPIRAEPAVVPAAAA